MIAAIPVARHPILAATGLGIPAGRARRANARRPGAMFGTGTILPPTSGQGIQHRDAFVLTGIIAEAGPIFAAAARRLDDTDSHAFARDAIDRRPVATSGSGPFLPLGSGQELRRRDMFVLTDTRTEAGAIFAAACHRDGTCPRAFVRDAADRRPAATSGTGTILPLGSSQGLRRHSMFAPTVTETNPIFSAARRPDGAYLPALARDAADRRPTATSGVGTVLPPGSGAPP